MTDVRELFLDALGGVRAATPAELVAACCATLPADHVAILLATPAAGLELAAASDPVAARWEDAQVTLGDGPAVEAFGAGGPVLVPDLDEVPPARWPVLSAAHAPRRVGAVHSLPLQVGAIRLGVLELLHDAPRSLSEAELRDALTVAAMTTTTLLVGGSEDRDRPGYAGPGGPARPGGTATPPGEPWAGVEVGAEIHQATGMILVQLDVGAAEAYLRLRAHAFRTGRPLLEVARDVVARRLRLDPTPDTDTDPETDPDPDDPDPVDPRDPGRSTP